MSSTKEQIKQVTLRWPEDFWETVTIEATKRRTSVQAVVIEAVAKYLKISVPKSEKAA